MVLSLLALVLLANAVPVLVGMLLGRALDEPVDGGQRLGDGQRVLGAGKTYRGIIAALVATMAGAELLGIGWTLGLVIGTAAMVGDLASSFLKRRLGRPAHSKVPLVDNVPEALLPVAAVAAPLGLSWLEGALVVLGFVLGHTLLDPLSLRIRRRLWRD